MPVAIDDTANGTVATVQRGDALRITLAGNPTTGYSWTRKGHLSKEASENLHCDALQVNKSYTTSAPPGMCGGGGHFTFDVVPKSLGTHKLELVYARPWEPEDAAVKSFSVDVHCVA